MNWAEEIIGGKIRVMGREVTVRGPQGDVRGKAIIDPVDSVSREARTANAAPEGICPPGSYQYFGLPEVDLKEAELVLDGQDCYLIRRKEC